MKKLLALLLVLTFVFVTGGCASKETNGGDASSLVKDASHVSDTLTSDTGSSQTAVTVVEKPDVKEIITSVKTGGTGNSATDKLGGDAISLTPMDYSGSENAVYNDTGDGCTLLTVSSTTADEYNSYISKLTSAGYVKVNDTRKVLGSENISTLLCNGSYLVNAVFTPSTAVAKISIEPLKYETASEINQYLSVYDSAFSYESNVCEPLLISMGLSTSENGNDAGYYNTGLSYILRLSDGSFIIFDGGDNTAVNDHAGRIYAILKNFAPNKEDIRISAWIITHPHGDHARAFLDFCGGFLSDSSYHITLENVIANLPKLDSMLANATDASKLLVSSVRDAIATCENSGTKVYKSHVGQVYNFCGTTIETFYTYDLTLPAKCAKGMDNTFSLGLMVTLGGKKILINGDMTSIGINTVNSLYGTNLKCDIVQVPHHGTVSNFKSSSDPTKQAENFSQLSKFYTDYTKASYAIWPSTNNGKVYYLVMTPDQNPNAILKTLMLDGNIIAAGDNVKTLSFKTMEIKQYSYSEIGY